MIQRIQSVYLLIAFAAMVACVFFPYSIAALVVFPVLAALCSLLTIFLYKKRPVQSSFSLALCCLGLLFIIVLALSRDADTPVQEDGTLWTSGLTAVATLCWFLAHKAIMKDEKLVRSLDRIR